MASTAHLQCQNTRHTSILSQIPNKLQFPFLLDPHSNATPTMTESEYFRSPANLFLQQEAYRLGASPGLRSLPQGPERDFLTLTWGPVIYRTTSAPESKDLPPPRLPALPQRRHQPLHSSRTTRLRQAAAGAKEYILLQGLQRAGNVQRVRRERRAQRIP